MVVEESILVAQRGVRKKKFGKQGKFATRKTRLKVVRLKVPRGARQAICLGAKTRAPCMYAQTTCASGGAHRPAG